MSGNPDRDTTPGATPDPQPSDEEDFGVIEDLAEDEADEQPEPEPEEELEPEEPEPPPRLTRRERQQENWRERAIRAEAERDVYQRNQTQPRQAPQVDPAAQQRARDAEYERISMLAPHEQIGAIHQMMQRETAVARLEAFDLNDRNNFQRLQETFPAARRLAGRVEDILQQQRQNGIYAFSREQIFDNLYGNEVRTRGAQRGAKERNQGAERVRRQTVRAPSGARGDVPRSNRRGRSQEDQDRALLGTPIRDTM